MERDLRVTPPFRAVDRRKGSITLSGPQVEPPPRTGNGRAPSHSCG